MTRLGTYLGPTHGEFSERDRVEQGIAREETDDQIAREQRVEVEYVRRVRREMNQAVARGSVERPRRKGRR